MALLQNILYKVKLISVSGTTHVEVQGVETDSRKVKTGDCFVAIKGLTSDGHDYISKAIENGANVIVCERFPSKLEDGINYILVENSAAAGAILAHNFFDRPSAKCKLIGVTGTNGKTTVATLLFRLFTDLGYKCGLISTVQNQIGSSVLPSMYTTPDAVSLNRLLAGMVKQHCRYVFMEVSSHALAQHRIDGLAYAGGIFTNISHDHLDYHETFDEYIRVKKSFFDALPSSAFALSNADDKRGQVMLQNTRASKYFYSLKTMASFKGKIMENSLLGLLLLINDVEVHCRLIGAFNAYNLLAVYGAAICLGQKSEKILPVLSRLEGAEGRFDHWVSPKENTLGIIDYAHTPDALLNVLTTIKGLRQGNQKIITVVGCGGDRDKTKRPEMAAVACEYSDKVIFTSDNPRNEDPAEIIRDMEKGVPVTARKKCLSIVDRKEAIKTAVSLSGNNDIILVAGKGHERYQETKGVKRDFDDKKTLVEMFSLLDK